MAKTNIVVRLSDVERFRLLVWELRQLQERLNEESSPHAEELERALDRFTGDGPDEDRA